jgi:hypothetical protein
LIFVFSLLLLPSSLLSTFLSPSFAPEVETGAKSSSIDKVIKTIKPYRISSTTHVVAIRIEKSPESMGTCELDYLIHYMNKHENKERGDIWEFLDEDGKSYDQNAIRHFRAKRKLVPLVTIACLFSSLHAIYTRLTPHFMSSFDSAVNYASTSTNNSNNNSTANHSNNSSSSSNNSSNNNGSSSSSNYNSSSNNNGSSSSNNNSNSSSNNSNSTGSVIGGSKMQANLRLLPKNAKCFSRYGEVILRPCLNKPRRKLQDISVEGRVRFLMSNRDTVESLHRHLRNNPHATDCILIYIEAELGCIAFILELFQDGQCRRALARDSLCSQQYPGIPALRDLEKNWELVDGIPAIKGRQPFLALEHVHGEFLRAIIDIMSSTNNPEAIPDGTAVIENIQNRYNVAANIIDLVTVDKTGYKIPKVDPVTAILAEAENDRKSPFLLCRLICPSKIFSYIVIYLLHFSGIKKFEEKNDDLLAMFEAQERDAHTEE